MTNLCRNHFLCTPELFLHISMGYNCRDVHRNSNMLVYVCVRVCVCGDLAILLFVLPMCGCINVCKCRHTLASGHVGVLE